MANILWCNKTLINDISKGFQGRDEFDTNILFQADNNGEITELPFDAIPSPFANLEKVKQAFGYVNKRFNDKSREGKTAQKAVLKEKSYYHRIISECFDTGTLFFFGKNNRMRYCSIKSVNEQYDESGKLGTAIKLFEKDILEKNGWIFPNLNVVKWHGVIVGGTSPLSLFVPASGVAESLIHEAESTNDRYKKPEDSKNEEKYKKEVEEWRELIKKEYFPKIGDHILYSDDIIPLIHPKRPKDFISYVCKNKDIFGDAMPELKEYVTHSFDVLGEEEKEEIINYNLGEKDNNPIVILKKEENNEELKLIGPKFVSNDFFEDYVIESAFNINDEKIFCFKKDKKYYFPPIKNSYFESGRTVEDLVKNLKLLENDSDENTLVFELTIPGLDPLKKIYKKEPSDASQGLIHKNENEFCVTFLPFVNTANRVWFSTETPEDKTCNISFYCGKNNIVIDDESKKIIVKDLDIDAEWEKIKQTKFDTNEERKKINQTMFDMNEEYDRVKIDFLNDKKSLFVIPKPEKFKVNQNQKIYDFSVDIGTTNTHVAYKVGDDKGKDFNLFDGDVCVNLFKDKSFCSTNLGELLDLVVLPDETKKVSFPLRSVLWKEQGATITEGTQYFEQAGWNFRWETQGEYHSTSLDDVFKKESETNFKWKKGNRDPMKKAIEGLCILIAAFLQKNNGKLGTFTASYPISMISHPELEACWNNIIKDKLKSFIPSESVNSYKINWITESQAPLLFYQEGEKNKKYKIAGDYTSVTIDIGGGSTDISVTHKEKNIYRSASFQFAGSVIFGDGSREDSKENDFTHQSMDLCKNFLENKSQMKKQYLEWLRKKNKPSVDIHSFLFSCDTAFNYSSKLLDEEWFQLVYRYFYAAILFHVCEILKKCGLGNKLPYTMIFSGNSSKILKDMKNLEGFTNAFCKKCLNLNDNATITNFTFGENPKVLTAIGGLYVKNKIQYNKIVLQPLKMKNETGEDIELKAEDFKKPECIEAWKENFLIFDELFTNVVLKKTTSAEDQNPFLGFSESQNTWIDKFKKLKNPLTADKKIEETYNIAVEEINQEYANNMSEFLAEPIFFIPLKYILHDLLVAGYKSDQN